MIEVNSLNKFYPVGNSKFHVLKDINFAIKDGDSVAIQGKSGAGKSTLLHILGCLDNFDSGSYRLDDVEVSKLKDGTSAKLRNDKIGFVMQDFSLVNHKSVLFNVMLPLYFNRTPSRKMKKMAMEALELVEISEQAEKKANQLSGGQRQRVAIARAIVNHPNLILADEPTGALDTETSAHIMDLLKSMNDRGMTLIVVTHDDNVASCCSKKIILQDGKIISSTLECASSTSNESEVNIQRSF